MTKKVETGAAPVSKYAAKKRANAIASKEEVEQVINFDKEEDNSSMDVPTETNRKPVNKKNFVNGLPPITAKFPEHFVQIALIIKNNAEIRRFTALGILNYLAQKKELNGDKRYVSFKWNKFAVIIDGLTREYSYNEPFFINALIAAFSSFSASAQRTIDNFCKKEMSIGIAKAADQGEIDNIVALNEEYQEQFNITETNNE